MTNNTLNQIKKKKENKIMAQNWNVKQALAAINKGDKEAITDIGRRFPLTSNILARIGEDKAAGELIGALPDHITVRKIESILKDGVQVDDSDNDVEVDDKPVKAKATKSDDDDYSKMTGDQLIALLKDAGVYKDCIKKMGGGKKQQMLDYIEKYGLETKEANTDEDDVEEATDENPYSGKTAMELFKECKKRGLKAKPKQKAAFYADLLTKDDQSKSESNDAEDDDWEDETEEEKPVKSEKKAPAKKAAKKEEPEDDDDDDWDI